MPISTPAKPVDDAQLTGLQYRYAAPLQSTIVDEQKNVVEFVFASSDPVERYGYFPDQQIYGRFDEVLSMGKAHVNLDRVKNSVCMLLDNHRADQRVGKVLECNFDEKVGTAKVKIGRSTWGEQYLRDVEDGTEPGKSFGYRVRKYEVVSPAKYELDEDGYRKTIQKAVLKAVDWELFEISLASIPADSSVGFTDYRKGEEPIALDMRSVVIDGDPKFENVDLRGTMADLNEDKAPDISELQTRVNTLEASLSAKDDRISQLEREKAEIETRASVTASWQAFRSTAEGLVRDLKLSPPEFEALFDGDRASADKLLQSADCSQHLFYLRETLASAARRSPGLPTGFRVNELFDDRDKAASPSLTGESTADYAARLVSTLGVGG